MAISTRSTAIAQCAGSVVKFEARDPLGTVSKRKFMAHATRGLSGEISTTQGTENGSSISTIVSMCGGLPIALAVTGCAVAYLANLYCYFQKACGEYSEKLEDKLVWIGQGNAMEGTSLDGGIFLSLEFLEAELFHWKKTSPFNIAYSISDLYTSLCVLQHQAWVPVSVLGRLWQMDEDATKHV